MTYYEAGSYDVAVIGAGHKGTRRRRDGAGAP